MITVFMIFNDDYVALECPYGFSLMQCLKDPVNNLIVTKFRDNILATCGGNMSCSSCVVKIHDDFIDLIPSMDPQEFMFIDIFLDHYNLPFKEGQYRLSCQIPLTDELNGLKFSLV